MTQEQIDKLQELKKLFDAGILTQEEMQAEKAKILGTGSNEPYQEPSQEKSAVVVGEPEEAIEEKPTVVNNTVVEEASNGTKKRNIILGVIAGILVLILIIAFATSRNSSTSPEKEYIYANSDINESIYNDPSEVKETVNNDGTTSETADDDEFGLDPWNGSLNIVGDIYRTCSTLAYITLNKTGKGMYNGTMELMLGDADIDIDTGAATGKFFDDQGHLKGNLRAKAEGQTLTIVLDSYSITKPSEFFDDLSKGQQIFRLTYDGQTYTAQAVGKMQTFFDSIEVK